MLQLQLQFIRTGQSWFESFKVKKEAATKLLEAMGLAFSY